MSETDLLNVRSVNFDKILYVDCYYNKISLPQLKITFSINESQKRLMLCLLRDISSKQDIMQVVWNDSHLRLRDNNYHQLVFQMRALLQRNGLPSELIMTIPHYGLKLNAPLLQSLIDCRISTADLAAGKRAEETPRDRPSPALLAAAGQAAHPRTEAEPVLAEQKSVKGWLSQFASLTRFVRRKS